MHILIVEDERALCDTIVRSLRRLAYSVDFCYNGNKALELIEVERYDLILLDLEYLLLNKGCPVSQEELIDHVWDNSVDNFSNSIRVHISSLRKKLRAALGYDPIRNRIGEGYVMEARSE